MERHTKKSNGLTGRESRCDYAIWWDCNFGFACRYRYRKCFLIRSCIMSTPIFKECKRAIGAKV